MRLSPPRPRRPVSLAAKLGTLGAALMVLALGSIALTLWVTWQLEGGAAAVNEAGRLRMQSWRLAQAVSAGDPARAEQLARRFDDSVTLLRSGDPARPLLVPADAKTRAALRTMQQDWAAQRARWLKAAAAPATQAPTAAAVAAEADALVERVDRLVGLIEARLSHWTSLLTLFQLLLMGLAIAAGITLLYAAHLFIFRPLAALQTGLGAVEQGDLTARVEVASADEFGRVGEGFNRMAARLADLYRGLERAVAEKTANLRAERERLAVLYEATRFVARAPSLQALADGFAERVRRAGRADAALLRWNDSAQQQFVLLATDGVPAEMLKVEQCLDHGRCHCGVVPVRSAGSEDAGADVTSHGAASAAATPDTFDTTAAAPNTAEGPPPPRPASRVIAIAGPGNAPRRACEAFGFTHVLTVPVLLQDQLLGEVDLLWRGARPERSPEDQALIESLAAQLASGMEGMRVAALEREAAVSEERSLIARELHDSIAQALAFMKIQIQLLRTSLRKGDAEQAGRVTQELDAGVRESMADVRELLLHFRTRAQGDDVVAALRTTLQKFQHQTGIATHLDVSGRGVPLAPDVQVQVLHVVQEALSNVRKHARAGQVWLTVQQHPQWRFEVRDDGRGFAANAGAGTGADDTHVGLRIMRERAAGIGAEVTVTSAPGAGTRVALEWPPGASPAAAAQPAADAAPGRLAA